MLYLVAGAALGAVSIFGYQYQERREPQGVQINLGPNGVTFEKK